MARPLRTEGAGLWYHVMCHGNGGQPVYADKKDREAFLKRLGSVARANKIPPEAMMKAGKGRGGNEARQVTLWLARERCGAHATLRDIGTAMGGIGGSAVSMACHRIARRTTRDKHLRRMLERLS